MLRKVSSGLAIGPIATYCRCSYGLVQLSACSHINSSDSTIASAALPPPTYRPNSWNVNAPTSGASSPGRTVNSCQRCVQLLPICDKFAKAQIKPVLDMFPNIHRDIQPQLALRCRSNIHLAGTALYPSIQSSRSDAFPIRIFTHFASTPKSCYKQYSTSCSRASRIQYVKRKANREGIYSNKLPKTSSSCRTVKTEGWSAEKDDYSYKISRGFRRADSYFPASSAPELFHTTPQI